MRSAIPENATSGCRRGRQPARRWLLAGVTLVVGLFAAAASHAAVSIDQSPLTAQKPLSPNLVLMLDDSGSMAWDFMPDWGYLRDSSDDGARDFQINNTYYNPNIVYGAPPKANGTQFPDAWADASDPLGTAYLDGFDHGQGTADVSSYNSPGDYSPPYTQPQHASSKFPYYENFTATVAPYDAEPGCVPGDTLEQSGDHQGQCEHITTTTTLYNDNTCLLGLVCLNLTLSCNPGDKTVLVGTKQGGLFGLFKIYLLACQHEEQTSSYYAPSMDNPVCLHGGYLDSSGAHCITNDTVTVNLFTYTERNPSGDNPKYIRHYVGKSQQDCQVAKDATGNPNLPCDFSLETQKNVATWFAYYRTRLLLAKSGLMIAFTTLPADTRFGFGSINENNTSALPAPTYGSVLAKAQPFGLGDTGSQKAYFWNWLLGEKAEGGTPLRSALDDAGKYYETSQPWQNSDDDSTQLACRQSYTLLTTDGFWNGNFSGAGNVDATNGPSNISANGDKYRYSAVAPYSDDTASTLADVAMDYWKKDLMPNLANEVPPSPEDPAFWQHMTTFTMGLGFLPVNIAGTAADGSKDGSYDCSGSGRNRQCGFDGTATTTIQDFVGRIFDWANGGQPIAGFKWPQPSGGGNSGGNINNIADMVHAAVNGHGGFYSATSPQSFIAGIASALARVAERVGTGASLAANSTKLDTGTTTYQAFYYTGKWKGDLQAYSVNPNTGAIASSPNWKAAQQLPGWQQRVVWTYNPAAGKAVQFTAANLSQLSTAEQSALGANATDRAQIINYLLGDSSLETSQDGGIYRQRDTALGDIVDSQPVYDGKLNPNLFLYSSFTGSSSYPGFASTQSARTAMVWVAANDGMVHEFNAATGVENYAFLPGGVITNGVAALAQPGYGTSTAQPHEYFNDGRLTIADAYVSGAWKTVLVGTTGRGLAKTVYALDVTNRSNPTVLWERSAGDGKTNSDYIGQITGAPNIALAPSGQWVVYLGNGYNSTKGSAALLQFNLSTGALSAYPAGSATDNGLAAPTFWIGNAVDGKATVAYAGDLDGKVWSFDLSDPGSAGTLLFVAKDAGGTPQPITGGMLAAKDPQTGNRWLFFGTGRYLAQAELADTSVQTWYGIIVKPGSSQPQTLTSNLANGRAALVKRSITAEQAPNSNANPPDLGGRIISDPTGGDMQGKSGWYIDLISPTQGKQGERMVLANQFLGGMLIGTTRIPTASDPCNPSGSGWIMAINPFAGTNPAAPFFDLNNDGKFDDSDKINGEASAAIGFTSVPNAPIVVGNTLLTSFDNGSHGSTKINPQAGAGMQPLSWRELISR